MATTGPSGHFDPIDLSGPATGTAPLRLCKVGAQEARILGAGFAAIDPWARYPYPASALEGYFAAEEPGAPRYAIKLDTALAGALGLRHNWLRGPYIQFLGLLPGHQSAGIGASILGWIESQARGDDQRNLWVAASDFNTRAIRFYERYGFTRTADLDGLVGDGKIEVLLRKRL